MITMKGEEVLAADESGDSDKWIEMQTLTVGEGGFSDWRLGAKLMGWDTQDHSATAGLHGWVEQHFS